MVGLLVFWPHIFPATPTATSHHATHWTFIPQACQHRTWSTGNLFTYSWKGYSSRRSLRHGWSHQLHGTSFFHLGCLSSHLTRPPSCIKRNLLKIPSTKSSLWLFTRPSKNIWSRTPPSGFPLPGARWPNSRRLSATTRVARTFRKVRIPFLSMVHSLIHYYSLSCYHLSQPSRLAFT